MNNHPTTAGRQRRRAATLAVAVLLGATGSILTSTPASANLTGSSFEGGDGNLVVAAGSTNTDWVNVPGLNTGIDTPSGSTDNAFGQGTKEDNSAVTVVNGSIPPNKNDLSRFYEASSQGANSHIYLDLAWERLVNIGNANLDFEINQQPTKDFTGLTTGPVSLTRTAGDLLVTYDFGGSGTPTLGINTWLTAAAGNTVSQCFSANALPCWGLNKALTGTNSEGAVNTSSVAEPIANTTLGTGLFGEAAIDLTAAGVFQPGVCQAFGSAFVKSRSSSSFTAEIKDFIAPIPVKISNCGTITVKKVTENGDSSFAYGTSGLTPSTFSLSNGGVQTYGNVNAGTYTVAENLTADQVAAGWTLKSIVCADAVSTAGTTFSQDGSKETINLGLGGNVTCTYTNHINLSPTIATALSPTTISAGGSANDSATLSGATANAGGTVTYHAYAGADTCTGTDLFTTGNKVDVTNGAVPNSPTLSFTSPGTYSFQAVYSGDTNNNGATSLCSTEQLLVKANPTIATLLSATVIDASGSVNDSAKLSGATASAGGKVTYHAYAGANTCTGTDLFTTGNVVDVTNGAVPDSPSLTLTAAGRYSFQAVYSGDTNNNGATSECSTEQLLVKANPTIATALSTASIDVGGSANDTATLSGATSDAGGTVTYHAYAGANTCTGTDLFTTGNVVDVTGGVVPNSPSLTFTNAGTYSFQAVYSGDANNNGSISLCSTEQLTVNKLQPGASTAQSLIPNDSFSLSGATRDVSGTITFRLYSPSDSTCLGTPALTETVTLTGTGGQTTNTTFVAKTEGTWRWVATYSGDSNNYPATSSCGTEQFTIKNS